MREYETWEVVKALKENGNQVFINSQGVSVVGVYECIAIQNGNTTLQNALGLDEKWTLIQEPVSFMEAVNAYDKGRTIKCECSTFGIRVYKPVEHINSSLIDNNRVAITPMEILSGTWYIED